MTKPKHPERIAIADMSREQLLYYIEYLRYLLHVSDENVKVLKCQLARTAGPTW